VVAVATGAVVGAGKVSNGAGAGVAAAVGSVAGPAVAVAGDCSVVAVVVGSPALEAGEAVWQPVTLISNNAGKAMGTTSVMQAGSKRPIARPNAGQAEAERLC